MCTRQPPHAACPAQRHRSLQLLATEDCEAELWRRIAQGFRLVDVCEGKCDPAELCIPCTLERPSHHGDTAKPPVIDIDAWRVLDQILSHND